MFKTNLQSKPFSLNALFVQIWTPGGGERWEGVFISILQMMNFQPNTCTDAGTFMLGLQFVSSYELRFTHKLAYNDRQGLWKGTTSEGFCIGLQVQIA